MARKTTIAEATEMAEFYLTKKYGRETINDLEITISADNTIATATCEIYRKHWCERFKAEVVMDTVVNTITIKEHRYIDNLSLYRNPELQ